MSYLTLFGSSCFTASGAHDLASRINKTSATSVKSINGVWVYFIDARSTDSKAVEQIKTLLGTADFSPPDTSDTLSDNVIKTYITPRHISPWSSMATSIAQVCGLKDAVTRIERGRLLTVEFEVEATKGIPHCRDMLYDRMTEVFSLEQPHLSDMFDYGVPAPLEVVDLFVDGQSPQQILAEYNQQMGLGLDDSEIVYLVETFSKLGRSPNDVELFMFAQVNSE